MQIISGSYKNRKLFTPSGMQTRPTSSRLRETLFNICQNYIEDTTFLDLFAGSGAMGLEAISRGAKQATFVDNHKESIKIIYKNIELLSVENQSKVLFGDVFELIDRLAKKGESFDIIYADPPYDTFNTENESFSELILHKIDNCNLLAPGGDLFIEDATEARHPEAGLQILELVSIRRHGKAVLHQYRRKKK